MLKRRPICAAVIERDTGIILRILRSTDACSSWIKKHFPGSSRSIVPFYTKNKILTEFDNQMQLGLTDNLVIEQLLWFGGVSKGLVSRKVRGR